MVDLPVTFTDRYNLYFTVRRGNVNFFIGSDLGCGGCFNHHNIFIDTPWRRGGNGRAQKEETEVPPPKRLVLRTGFHRALNIYGWKRQ